MLKLVIFCFCFCDLILLERNLHKIKFEKPKSCELLEQLFLNSLSEARSGLPKTSKMENFATIVNCSKSLTIIAKLSNLYVCRRLATSLPLFKFFEFILKSWTKMEYCGSWRKIPSKEKLFKWGKSRWKCSNLGQPDPVKNNSTNFHIRKNCGRLYFPPHYLVERFNVFYFECIKLP